MATADPAGEPADPLADFLGYQLRRASAVMMADLAESLATLKLRPAEASILMVISANAEITQSSIGRMLGIQRANMAPLTAGLARRGLIDRDAVDGRSQGLRLSATGTELAAKVRIAIEAHEARFLPELCAGERAALTARLREVRGICDEPGD